MYERFNDKARQVMKFANEEAQKLDHEYIGTEHILLGLVRSEAEDLCLAGSVFGFFGLELAKICDEVKKLVEKGVGMVPTGKYPLTPRAKIVLENAMNEATELKCSYIGAEHLLLGLLRESEGYAAQALMNLGLFPIEKVRGKIVELLGQKPAEPTEFKEKLPTASKAKPVYDSGMRAKTFAYVPGGSGINKLNDFLSITDERFILDKLQSSSGETVHVTIFYQLQK